MERYTAAWDKAGSWLIKGCTLRTGSRRHTYKWRNDGIDTKRYFVTRLTSSIINRPILGLPPIIVPHSELDSLIRSPAS